MRAFHLIMAAVVVLAFAAPLLHGVMAHDGLWSLLDIQPEFGLAASFPDADKQIPSRAAELPTS